MLKNFDLLSLYDAQMRINLRLPETVFENTGRIVRDVSSVENAGFIDYSNLDESNADAEIETQIAYFRGLNLPFTWKVYEHDRPADLRQRLAAHGFQIDEPSTLMILDLQNPPARLLEAAIPESIHRITEEVGIENIVRLEESVYQSPREWLRKRLLLMQKNTPHLLSLYAAVIDDKTVSAAWIIYYEGTQFASMLGGATLPAYRSRGYYAALLAVRAREALSRGVRFLVVDASPMSAPILEKRGFQPLEQTVYCRWSPNS